MAVADAALAWRVQARMVREQAQHSARSTVKRARFVKKKRISCRAQFGVQRRCACDVHACVRACVCVGVQAERIDVRLA